MTGPEEPARSHDEGQIGVYTHGDFVTLLTILSSETVDF